MLHRAGAVRLLLSHLCDIRIPCSAYGAGALALFCHFCPPAQLSTTIPSRLLTIPTHKTGMSSACRNWRQVPVTQATATALPWPCLRPCRRLTQTKRKRCSAVCRQRITVMTHGSRPNARQPQAATAQLATAKAAAATAAHPATLLPVQPPHRRRQPPSQQHPLQLAPAIFCSRPSGALRRVCGNRLQQRVLSVGASERCGRSQRASTRNQCGERHSGGCSCLFTAVELTL